MTSLKPSVLVIGLGQIGWHDAEYMKSCGLTVDGYDINIQAVQRAIDSGVIRKAAESFQGYDYYVIAVSTHNPSDMSQPSLDALFQSAERLAYQGKRNALVIIESTVTMGTCEEIKSILGPRFHVAHVPHRFFIEEKTEHGVRQTRVLGGCEPCCVTEALKFYRNLLGIPVHVVRSIKIAELSKIIENSYRFIEIAFAEELKMFCSAYSLDYSDLREAVNSKWNVKVLEARRGIDGHCLPKDSQMYVDLSREASIPCIVGYAKKVDEEFRKHIGRSLDIEVILPTKLLTTNAS